MINAVKVKTLPALDDEFAKDCGAYGSLAELQEKLRSEMEKALKREIEDTYKDTIVKRLIETHHFDLPEALVERELEAIIRQEMQQRERRAGRGETAALDADELAKLRQQSRDEAARRVKVGLILETVAEKENLTVTQEDLNNEIQRLATELKVAQAELVKMIQSGGQDAIAELHSGAKIPGLRLSKRSDPRIASAANKSLPSGYTFAERKNVHAGSYCR